MASTGCPDASSQSHAWITAGANVQWLFASARISLPLLPDDATTFLEIRSLSNRVACFRNSADHDVFLLLDRIVYQRSLPRVFAVPSAAGVVSVFGKEPRASAFRLLGGGASLPATSLGCSRVLKNFLEPYGPRQSLALP